MDTTTSTTSTTSSTTSLQHLPDEVVLCVLWCRQVSVVAVCRLASTCTRMCRLANTQHLWRHKMRQFWPKIWDSLPANNTITDWKDEVKQIICFDREVRKMVSGLSPRLYQNSHLTTPVYNEIDALVMSTPFAALYMKNALRRIIDDGGVYENLTEKYYALKVTSHVHQSMCQWEWKTFLTLPWICQSLEMGTMLLARWFQPQSNVVIKQMAADLDHIAEICCNKLRTTVPDHPAIAFPLVPPSEILPDSKWDQRRCEQLFKCINDVLFEQLKFTGNTDDYYSLKNSLINEVLDSRKGIPITLSIVYIAICHRLGIRLEPVNFPSHFLARWRIPGTSDFRFIDAFVKGRRSTREEVLEGVPLLISEEDRVLACCRPVQVFQRMIRNIMNVAQMQANISDQMELYCPATELMNLLNPNDRSVQELMLRIYYTLEVHYERIVAGCQHLIRLNPSTILEEMLTDSLQILKSESERPKPISPNHRTRDIAFATGLVMQHKRYNYFCVIFGWDKECKMPGDWVRRMGVDTLQHKTKQPFYNVLVNDGSHRYAAQENLSVAEEPLPISHCDVGKYFREFTGTHYLPNDQLLQQYPEDEAVRTTTLGARGLL